MANIENLLKYGKTPVMTFKGLKKLLHEFQVAISDGTFNKEKFDPANEIEFHPSEKPVDSAFYDYRKNIYMRDYVWTVYELYLRQMSKMIKETSIKEFIDNLPSTFKGISEEELTSFYKVGSMEISDYLKGKIDLPKYPKLIVDAIKNINSPEMTYDLLPYGNNKSDEDAYEISLATPRSKELFSFGHLYYMYCFSNEIRPKMVLESSRGKDKTKTRTKLYVTKEDLEKTLNSLEHFSDVFKYTVERCGTPSAIGLCQSIYSVASVKKNHTYEEAFKSISLKAISLYLATLILRDTNYFQTLPEDTKREIVALANVDSYKVDYSEKKPDIIHIHPELIKYVHSLECDIQDENTLSILESGLETLFSMYNFNDKEHTLYPISLSKETYEGLDVSFSKDYKSDILTNYQNYIENELVKLSLLDSISPEAAEIACKNIDKILTVYGKVASTIPGYIDTDAYTKFTMYCESIPYHRPYLVPVENASSENAKAMYYEYIASKYEEYLIQKGYKTSPGNLGR